MRGISVKSKSRLSAFLTFLVSLSIILGVIGFCPGKTVNAAGSISVNIQSWPDGGNLFVTLDGFTEKEPVTVYLSFSEEVYLRVPHGWGNVESVVSDGSDSCTVKITGWGPRNGVNGTFYFVMSGTWQGNVSGKVKGWDQKTPPPPPPPPGPTPTPTNTPTPIPTNTPTPTNTPRPTDTPTPTRVPTNTPTPTPRPTNTPTPTRVPTNTPTPTRRPTNTPTPTRRVTNTPTPTRRVTNTPTPTRRVTNTPTPTRRVTNTPTPTKRVTNTPTPTNTPAPTQRPGDTPTPSPTATPSPTNTPSPTPTPPLIPLPPVVSGAPKPTPKETAPSVTPTDETLPGSESTVEPGESTEPGQASENGNDTDSSETGGGALIASPSDDGGAPNGDGSGNGDGGKEDSEGEMSKYPTDNPAFGAAALGNRKASENSYSVFLWFGIFFVLAIAIYLRYSALAKRDLAFAEIIRNFIPLPFLKKKEEETIPATATSSAAYPSRPVVGVGQAYRPIKSTVRKDEHVQNSPIPEKPVKPENNSGSERTRPIWEDDLP